MLIKNCMLIDGADIFEEMKDIRIVNGKIKEVAEKIVKEEKTIEMEMKELYGNEVEGSTLFNVYSQMKRVGVERE